VARAALRGGEHVLPLPLALLVGFAPLVLAGAGATVAVVLERDRAGRSRRRNGF
jgi:hypothetical protein